MKPEVHIHCLFCGYDSDSIGHAVVWSSRIYPLSIWVGWTLICLRFIAWYSVRLADRPVKHLDYVAGGLSQLAAASPMDGVIRLDGMDGIESNLHRTYIYSWEELLNSGLWQAEDAKFICARVLVILIGSLGRSICMNPPCISVRATITKNISIVLN
jgi:hypothetical protein